MLHAPDHLCFALLYSTRDLLSCSRKKKSITKDLLGDGYMSMSDIDEIPQFEARS